MNNFDDVYALNRDERQISNLETYRRFISKGDKPLECINDEDAKAIKDVLSGKGKLLAVVDGRRSMAGNHKYVLFVKEEGGVKVYLYTVLNGLYNEMGPYKDLDTAMSNADCYGLFEECKQVANTKVLENSMNKKLFEEIIEDWDDDDVMTYDGDEMEDWSWEDEPEYDDDTYGYKSPSEELSDHFADNFPTRDPEYQNDEGDYDPFTYTQMGDGSGAIGYRTKAAAYAHNLRGGDYAPTLDDGTVLGGDFDNDDDSNFAMSDDADLDDWVREGKKVVFDNILKEGRNHNRVALRYAKSYEEFYDDDKHNAVAKQVEDVTGLPGWYVGEWGDGAIALVYSGDESDLTPEIVATARNIFKKAW